MKLFSIGERPAETAGTGVPSALRDLPASRLHDLDVRPALARGEEPLALILERAVRVGAGEVLRLRAPFEPVPLYQVLGERGFRAYAERRAADDWEVWFHRPASDDRCGGAFREREGRRAEAAEEGARDATARRPARPVAEDGAAQGPYLLDVRRLDGPEKHPAIHARFDALGPGQALTIVNDHDPKPLFYELCAERPDRFDAQAYRSYEAGERVWVAVLPVLPD